MIAAPKTHDRVLVEYADHLCNYVAIHRMIRGTMRAMPFVRNDGWRRDAAQFHAKFLGWRNEVFSAYATMDSRCHYRKRYNGVLVDVTRLEKDWAATVKQLEPHKHLEHLSLGH